MKASACIALRKTIETQQPKGALYETTRNFFPTLTFFDDLM